MAHNKCKFNQSDLKPDTIIVIETIGDVWSIIENSSTPHDYPRITFNEPEYDFNDAVKFGNELRKSGNRLGFDILTGNQVFTYAQFMESVKSVYDKLFKGGKQ